MQNVKCNYVVYWDAREWKLHAKFCILYKITTAWMFISAILCFTLCTGVLYTILKMYRMSVSQRQQQIQSVESKYRTYGEINCIILRSI